MDGPGDDEGPSAVPRLVALVLTATVVIPASLLFAYLLTWYLPEATGSTCGPDDVPSCRSDPVDTVAWWLLLATVVGGLVFLAVGWWRWWHDGRWWPWPVTALACVVAGVPLVSVLS